jgi:hypothetical protein
MHAWCEDGSGTPRPQSRWLLSLSDDSPRRDKNGADVIAILPSHLRDHTWSTSGLARGPFIPCMSLLAVGGDALDSYRHDLCSLSSPPWYRPLPLYLICAVSVRLFLKLCGFGSVLLGTTARRSGRDPTMASVFGSVSPSRGFTCCFSACMRIKLTRFDSASCLTKPRQYNAER